ncbi:MAG TPA: hypothetical protein VLS89_07995, partial [Candidatus Nanopelagicales bacterium]|nr:hypothetical protein [Candidatus Nanopelagicales bacterium]
MAKRRRHRAALLTALGLTAVLGLPAASVIQAAPEHLRPAVTVLSQAGPPIAQAQLFAPRPEVP